MEHIHEDKQASLEEQRMQALDMAKSGNPRQAEKLLRQVVAGWESAQPPNDVMHCALRPEQGIYGRTTAPGGSSGVLRTQPWLIFLCCCIVFFLSYLCVTTT